MEELVGNHSNVCQTHSIFYSVRQRENEGMLGKTYQDDIETFAVEL